MYIEGQGCSYTKARFGCSKVAVFSKDTFTVDLQGLAGSCELL